MRRGRIPTLQSRAGWCAMQRSQSAAIRLEVGGVDPGGQLTASGGALRVDAIVGHRSADVAGVDPASSGKCPEVGRRKLTTASILKAGTGSQSPA